MKSHRRSDVCPLLQDIRPVFLEIIALYLEVIEQGQFKAIILFIGLLPGNIGVCISGDGNAGSAEIALNSKYIPSVGVVHVHLRQIEETVGSASDFIITYQAVGGLQFQLGDDLLEGFEEFLIRHHITGGNGREKAETVLLTESFRSVITKIPFQEIAGVEIVCQTSRQSQVPVRQR